MSGLIKQVFTVLLSFGEPLATSSMPLKKESCMVRPTLDLNPVEQNYYLFMISLNKYIGSCNTNDLSPKILVPSKTKDVNVELFNMIKNSNDVKLLVKDKFK